jgi:hypothetical protein
VFANSVAEYRRFFRSAHVTESAMKVLFSIAGFAFCIIACVSESLAGDKRSASKIEIESYISNGRTASSSQDGYSYMTGRSEGFKVRDGSICIRFGNGASDCVKVLTDGKKFWAVMKNGERFLF